MSLGRERLRSSKRREMGGIQMKREILRESDFVPASTNRREKGKAYRSDCLQPANLTDTQEASLVTVFRTLDRKPRKDKQQ